MVVFTIPSVMVLSYSRVFSLYQVYPRLAHLFPLICVNTKDYRSKLKEKSQLMVTSARIASSSPVQHTLSTDDSIHVIYLEQYRVSSNDALPQLSADPAPKIRDKHPRRCRCLHPDLSRSSWTLQPSQVQKRYMLTVLM